jgi:FlaA1/EpsC-like NDP-sugar epimerase
MTSNATPVFVLGAGDAAAMRAGELERSREDRAVDLFDDTPDRLGCSLHVS